METPTLYLAVVMASLACVAAAAWFVGVGRLVDIEEASALDSFWLGAATVTVSLQAWHLLSPISGWTALTVTAASIAGWLRRPRMRLVLPLWGLPCVAAAVWLAARGQTDIHSHGDTGLYHLQAIRWAMEHPAVPGLGNIHPFLGVNHGAFLTTALIASLPLPLAPTSVTNSVWASAFCFWTARGIARLIRGEVSPQSVYDVAIAPWCVFLVFNSRDVGSGSSDLCELVAGSVLLSRWIRHQTQLGERPLPLVILACFCAVVKLSSVVAATVVVVGVIWAAHKTPRRALLASALAGIVALAWSIKTVLQTGYLPYPGALVSFDVDWRMPKPLVDAVRDWTLVYGRSGRHSEKLFSLNWLPNRLEALAAQLEEVRDPLIITLGVCVLFVVSRPKLRRLPFLLVLCAPVTSQFLFWLLTSPKLRYSGVWIQGVHAVLLACVAANLAKLGLARLRWAVLVLIVLRIGCLGSEWPIQVPGGAVDHYPAVAFREFTTASGAVVHTTENWPGGAAPRTMVLCWDTPRPCAQWPDAALEQRDPKDVAAGFRIRGDLATFRSNAAVCCEVERGR